MIIYIYYIYIHIYIYIYIIITIIINSINNYNYVVDNSVAAVFMMELLINEVKMPLVAECRFI